MASVNKVILVGNLGADPESRFAPSGDAICNISVATTESWKDKQIGEKKEATEWHRVGFFGKLADIAGQYLKKGSQVYIEGSLRTRKWQDKTTGQDRYTTEILVGGFDGKLVMLDGAKGAGSDTGAQQQANHQPHPFKTNAYQHPCFKCRTDFNAKAKRDNKEYYWHHY